MKLLPLAVASALLLGSTAQAETPALSPASTHWIKANGVSLRYELTGRGDDTVVLLHEMSVSMETWDYIVPELARSHRVLRYDLRGFGLSERIKATMTMDDEMSDLRGLLEALNIKGKVILIGGAIGGAIALKYAATYPDQVQAVAAISPAAYMKARPVGGAGSPPGAGGPQAATPQPGFSGPDAAFPVKLQKAHPDRFERFNAIQAAAAPASSAETTPAAYSVSYAEVLPNIKCPAMIVATSLWVRPPESFKELADAIPGARFEVIETGHFASIESPELVIPVLNSFLKDVRAKR